MPIRIAVEDTPTPADLGAVEEGLTRHATQSGVEERRYEVVTVFARDTDGRAIGGLVGATVWGWLHVKQLWVAEPYRRRGHGTSLLQVAEEEARRRGCHHVLLDTFDFQAREHLGYEVFGSLADFPRGHLRYFMRKALPETVAG